MRLLIVEDDKDLADTLKEYLGQEGFVVDTIQEGLQAEKRIELYHKDYDLIILDWMLPGKDGKAICEDIRKKNITTPILMLTARRELEDKVAGLSVGADDYLPKPFAHEELLARIKALLRRPREAMPNKLTAGNLVLDPIQRKVFVNKKEIVLTQKEYSLLEYFLSNPNRALDREQIFSHIWDFASNSMSNVVDVHLHYLKKKVGKSAGLFEAIPGVGYRLKV